MTPEQIDRVFGRGRLKMATGEHVEVFREAIRTGERRRYTKRFLNTQDGDFAHWTEREWRILARLIGHGIGCVPDIVQIDRAGFGGTQIVQTYDAGATVDQWATILPVSRQGRVCRHVFEDCAHWWALAHHCLTALRAIHALQLVHLDVKGDNVCIPVGPPDFDPDADGQRLHPLFGQLALIDFAFSLVSREPLSHPLPIGWQTTYDYQSPRLLRALEAGRNGDLQPTRELDWRCDMYSLAAMLKRYLPDDDLVRSREEVAGWTPERYHAAKALLLALRDSHDREAVHAHPHEELLQITHAQLEGENMIASLDTGWTLARDADVGPVSALPITPLTRLAPSIRSTNVVTIATRVVPQPHALPPVIVSPRLPADAPKVVRRRNVRPDAPDRVVAEPFVNAELSARPTRRWVTPALLALIGAGFSIALGPHLREDLPEIQGAAERAARAVRQAFAGGEAQRSATQARSSEQTSGVERSQPLAQPTPESAPVQQTQTASAPPAQQAQAASLPPVQQTQTATVPPAQQASSVPSVQPPHVASIPSVQQAEAASAPPGQQAQATRVSTAQPPHAASAPPAQQLQAAESPRARHSPRTRASSPSERASATGAGKVAATTPRKQIARASPPPRLPEPAPAVRVAVAAPQRDKHDGASGNTHTSSAPSARSDSTIADARTGGALAQSSTTQANVPDGGAPRGDPATTVSSAPQEAQSGTTVTSVGGERMAAGSPASSEPRDASANVSGSRASSRDAAHSQRPPREGFLTSLLNLAKRGGRAAPIEERAPAGARVVAVPAEVKRTADAEVKRTAEAEVKRTAEAEVKRTTDASPSPKRTVLPAEAPPPAKTVAPSEVVASPGPGSSPAFENAAARAPVSSPSAVLAYAEKPDGISDRSAEIDGAGEFARRGRIAVANVVSGATVQVETEIARVLARAAASYRAEEQQWIVEAARRSWGRNALPIASSMSVSRETAAALKDEARRAFWAQRDQDRALDLHLQAFGADAYDAEVAGNLASLYLRARPSQPHAARQLAMHAIAVTSAQARAPRVQDWGTFAVASALLGRDDDATHALFVAAALASNLGSTCKTALGAVGTYGDRMRVPVESMLLRIHEQGRDRESPYCTFPPRWSYVARFY